MLKEYRKKRNFDKTPEPIGKQRQNNNLFVVQKHDARRLHYDFRLELDGVLKSWAVPKGPCLDPEVKRLAINVEDHPIEYSEFEGIIPKGEYGAGTVLLWDKGTWNALDEDPDEAYEKGHLRFELHGKKLKGRWDLVCFKPEERSWFLIKHQDDYAKPLKSYDITKKKPDSVNNNQSLSEISQNYDAIWSKNLQAELLKLPTSPFPAFLKPQLTTRVDRAPAGDEWLHEIKFDGYRILAFKQKNHVRLVSRNNKDWTKSFQTIADQVLEIPAQQIVLDGEIVVLNDKNCSDFQLLQNAIKTDNHLPFIYYVFDLLYFDQWNTQPLSLVKRKDLLKQLISDRTPNIRFSDYIQGQGDEVFQNSCQLGLEGIISKRLDSEYINSRSSSWLKIKCIERQEFIVGGFTKPKGSRSYFGSLLLGLYDATGKLEFCGKVGTGFSEKSLTLLHKKIKPLIISESPFKTLPNEDDVTWVKPQLIVEVEFTEWTNDGRLRHPSFKGLREDKSPKNIHKEIKKSVAETSQTITNEDKILYPEDEITKGQLITYYSEIASYILPYIKNRPLTLVRCPDGYQNCFYQKHLNESTSQSLKSIAIESSNSKKNKNYMYLDSKEGLISLAQMGVLEIHPWGSTIKDLEKPDVIIIDLDPSPELEWQKTVNAALLVKKRLEDLNLQSFVKSTGGKGLHVVIPIKPIFEWAIIKQFAKLFVEFIRNENPDDFVTTITKSKREGKIFLDYLRNQRGATAVAPYSPRAKIHAPVATPLSWGELSSNQDDNTFTILTLPKRLKTLKEDPWKDIWTLDQTLPV